MIYNKRYVQVRNLVDLSVNTYLTFTFSKGSVPTGNFKDNPFGQSRSEFASTIAVCVHDMLQWHNIDVPLDKGRNDHFQKAVSESSFSAENVLRYRAGTTSSKSGYLGQGDAESRNDAASVGFIMVCIFE